MNIDNFFQEQNEKLNIDQSQLGTHWQKMQQQMKPVAKPLWKPIAIAVSVLAVGLLSYFIISSNDKKPIVENKNEVQVLPPNTTTKVEDLPNENKIKIPVIESPKVEKHKPVIENTKPIVEKKSIVTTKPERSNIIQKQALFYIDLTKEPEIFTINPTKDNNIKCKQGTKIKIPANSIVDAEGNKIEEEISVIVQEYYRYVDHESNETVDAGMIKYEFYKGLEKLYTVDNKTIVVSMKSPLTNENIKIIYAEDAMPEATLKELRWVSAENFTSDKRYKIDYKITLDKKYDASTFMSEIAFPKQKVIMAGDIVNNSIIFHNVPVGETAYFMSIGKINNKYFSCSKKLITGNTNIREVDFVEITETLYKKQIEELGKLGQ